MFGALTSMVRQKHHLYTTVLCCETVIFWKFDNNFVGYLAIQRKWLIRVGNEVLCKRFDEAAYLATMTDVVAKFAEDFLCTDGHCSVENILSIGWWFMHGTIQFNFRFSYE
jgi:hypothetical protein